MLYICSFTYVTLQMPLARNVDVRRSKIYKKRTQRDKKVRFFPED